MFLVLMVLFVTLPLIELALLLRLGDAIGFLPSMAVVVGTGIVGAALARREGLKVIGKIQSDLQARIEPSQSIMDGLCVLAAGLMLITPGIITDGFGFALLIPPVRRVISGLILRAFARRVTFVQHSSHDPFVDVTATSRDADDSDRPSPPALDPMPHPNERSGPV